MNKSTLISKYFFPNAKEKEFNKWAIITLKAALDFLNNRNGKKIHGEISPKEISKLFSSPLLPVNGRKIPEILQETIENIVKNSVRVNHPKYIGHMTGSTPFISILCDIIISSLNQNVVKTESALAATYVEWQTLTWLHKLIYNNETKFYKKILGNSDNALGNYCSGGTLGNITALLVARNKAFPSAHKQGLFAAFQSAGYQNAVILVSQRGHYSLKKAAAIIGIGEDNVISIPCEKFSNKMNLNLLQNKIKTLIENRIKIIALVGIAGSTETGSIDELETLAAICVTHKIWFHVDAAWGGALLFSKKLKHNLKGISAADSVVIDGHKFMYLNMSHSAVLFKSEHALDCIRHSANYIIRKGSIDLGRTTIEGSRRFDSLKLWFHLKILGVNGFAKLVEKAIENATIFAEIIKTSASFELTSNPESSIVTYRFTGKSLKKILSSQFSSLNDSQSQFIFLNDSHKDSAKKLTHVTDILPKLNDFLSELNIYIQKIQRQNGKSFVSRTILETVYPSQEIVVLRAIPFNPLTNKKILTEILKEQELLGEKYLAKKLAGFIKMVPEAEVLFNYI